MPRYRCLVGLLLVPVAALAGTTSVSLSSPEGLATHGVAAEKVRYNGFDAIRVEVNSSHKRAAEGGCDSCTIALVEGIEFGDGVIEIDVAGMPVENAPPFARGFVGVVFRASDDGSAFEGIYLRPVNAQAEDPEQRNHTVQYFSYPDYPWHRLRRESPGKYETWADVTTGEWTHLEIRVQGSTAALYIDGADDATLVVDDLKHGAEARGAIGLFTEPATLAYFRNLVVWQADAN